MSMFTTPRFSKPSQLECSWRFMHHRLSSRVCEDTLYDAKTHCMMRRANKRRSRGPMCPQSYGKKWWRRSNQPRVSVFLSLVSKQSALGASTSNIQRYAKLANNYPPSTSNSCDAGYMFSCVRLPTHHPLRSSIAHTPLAGFVRSHPPC
jgi:hypothetical protein